MLPTRLHLQLQGPEETLLDSGEANFCIIFQLWPYQGPVWSSYSADNFCDGDLSGHMLSDVTYGLRGWFPGCVTVNLTTSGIHSWPRKTSIEPEMILDVVHLAAYLLVSTFLFT